MDDMLNEIAKETFILFKEKIVKLSYFDPLHYVNNVKSFQIKMTEDEQYCAAIYIVFSNTVLIPHQKTSVKLLLNELIHMASSNRTAISKMNYNKGYEVVISQYKRVTALNEGLTQLIVCNALDGNDLSNDLYPIETRVARMLTYIFGENEVYKHFFKAEPEAFIRNIMAKTGDNSIATLIVKMDELLDTMKKSETTSFNKNCGSILFDIQKTLVDMYVKMKPINDLVDDQFSKLFITPTCDNNLLSSVVASDDFGIEQYFTDKTKQK